jgi:hypothetical protein
VGNPGGVKPVWGQLEIQLTDYIVTMRAQRKAVNRIVVLHRALELVPNFLGGVLDPEFSKRAMRWYYRFIKRRQYNLSIQRPTSVGQKLPEGWQDLWRTCVSELLEMRRDPEILSLYNQQHPNSVPLEILPISNICNFDQSPQSVEPLHSSTLNVKGAGQCVLNTGEYVHVGMLCTCSYLLI